MGLEDKGLDDKPGIDGGLSPREKDNQVVNNIEVASLEATLDSIVRHGGKVLVGKSEIPGVGGAVGDSCLKMPPGSTSTLATTTFVRHDSDSCAPTRLTPSKPFKAPPAKD